jgi:uncharacterized protein involved in cysteine biosynthesis
VKQVAFPPSQRHVRWLTPLLLIVSVLCIAGVVAIVLSDVTAPFVGPWG